INYVNQKDTFRQLSENVLQRVAVFQESQAYLTRRWDNQVLYGLTRYSQNLTSLSDKTVLQTFPEVGYSLSPARLGGIPLYAGLDTTFDSFSSRAWRRNGRISFPACGGRFPSHGTGL